MASTRGEETCKFAAEMNEYIGQRTFKFINLRSNKSFYEINMIVTVNNLHK